MPKEETTYRDSVDQRIRVFEKNTSKTLDEILEQTKRTNGRVTTLEKEVINQRLWRAYITGGLTMLSVIVLGLLVPLVVAYIGKV